MGRAGGKTNIKWAAKLGSRAYALTVAGGKVFVGTNNQYARNPRDTRKRKDGKTEPIDKGILHVLRRGHRQVPLAARQRQAALRPGPRLAGGRHLLHRRPSRATASTTSPTAARSSASTPTASPTATRASQDEKYKDPTDADVIWRLDMMKELNVFPHNLAACSPLIVGDTLYVVTANGVDEDHVNIPCPDAPSFIAVDKNTGKVMWKSNAPGRNIMHGQWSNPAYAVVNGKPQVIFPGGDGWLRGFDPDTGKLIWKFDCNPKKAPKYDLGGTRHRAATSSGHAGRRTTTSSTSASARTPSTTTASATSGAST